jgi:type II secretory pathway pseudopilin PulG
MKMRRLAEFQRGATLIVGLIMLAVITLLVTTAFTLGNTNLKAVGNMQFRDEAAAAANMAIEQVLTAFISIPPTDQNIPVDLNNDGESDYTVTIRPTCITSSIVSDGSGIGLQGSVELPGLSVGGGGGGGYITVWDIDASVTDNASGAKIRLHQGVRKLLASLPPACA